MATRTRSTTPPPAARRLASGTGVDLTSPGASSAPPLPHERDEGVGMTGGVPSRQVQQAHRDLKRGVQDTSRAPEADRAYQQQKKK